ncbi:flagellar motor switch protein FliG, partial [Arthrobacter deserti]|nr:flagellar motor switch protein FliG [Arthrobacter deserti]
MQMEPVRAAQVMKQFSEAEAERITAEIVALDRVEPELAEKALAEFHEMTLKGRPRPRGGRSFAAGLLAASFGAEKAAGVLDRLASTLAGKPFEFLEDAESGQVVTLLTGELAQTIALVLAHLPPDQASAVLAGFHDELRAEVARCIATMGTATPEA